ncbi:MAG: hypothetical protein RL186_455 [Pseudomonadota bacterium]|jgi:hypothetical protein
MGGLDASAYFSARRVLHRPPSQTLPHKGEGLFQRDSHHMQAPQMPTKIPLTHKFA